MLNLFYFLCWLRHRYSLSREFHQLATSKAFLDLVNLPENQTGSNSLIYNRLYRRVPWGSNHPIPDGWLALKFDAGQQDPHIYAPGIMFDVSRDPIDRLVRWLIIPDVKDAAGADVTLKMLVLRSQTDDTSAELYQPIGNYPMQESHLRLLQLSAAAAAKTPAENTSAEASTSSTATNSSSSEQPQQQLIEQFEKLLDKKLSATAMSIVDKLKRPDTRRGNNGVGGGNGGGSNNGTPFRQRDDEIRTLKEEVKKLQASAASSSSSIRAPAPAPVSIPAAALAASSMDPGYLQYLSRLQQQQPF